MPSRGRHLLIALLFCACGASDPNIIATQQLDLIDIEARSGAVYWATASSIMTAPRQGGSVSVLAIGLGGGAIPTAMWVDDTDVYWVDSNSLLAVSVAGGSARTLASTDGMGLVAALTGDAANIYMSAAFGVWKVAKSGGSPVALVAFPAGAVPALFGIAVDDTNVYWTNSGNIPFSTTLNNGTVMRAPKDGGQPTTIATNQAYPGAIVADGTNVFWRNGGDNGYVPCAQDCLDGALMIAPAGSSSPSVFLSDPSVTRVVGAKLMIQGGFLYWVGGSDVTVGLLRAATTGGAVETVEAGLSALFAVDDTNVYYGYGLLNDHGDIHKTPKP